MLFDLQDDFAARAEASGLGYGEYARQQAKARQKRVYGDPWGRLIENRRRSLEAAEWKRAILDRQNERKQRERQESEKWRMAGLQAQLLRKFGTHSESCKLIKEIMAEVAVKYNFNISHLKSHRRARKLVLARQEVYWRAYTETSRSLDEIGRVVGNKHHTTILSGIRNYRRIRRVVAGLEPARPLDHCLDWSLVIPMEVE